MAPPFFSESKPWPAFCAGLMGREMGLPHSSRLFPREFLDSVIPSSRRHTLRQPKASVPAAGDPLLRRLGSRRPDSAPSERRARVAFASSPPCSGPAPPLSVIVLSSSDAPKGSGNFEDALLCWTPGAPSPLSTFLCLIPSVCRRIPSRPGTSILGAPLAEF